VFARAKLNPRKRRLEPQSDRRVTPPPYFSHKREICLEYGSGRDRKRKRLSMNKPTSPSRPYPEDAQEHIKSCLAAMLGDSASSGQWHWRSIMSSEGEHRACVASVETGRYSMKLYFSKKQMIEAQKKVCQASAVRQLEYVARQWALHHICNTPDSPSLKRRLQPFADNLRRSQNSRESR